LTCDPHILRPHCFSFTDPTTTATYTLSLHDALPISRYDLSPERPKPLSAFGATSALTFCIDGLSKSAGLPQVKLSWLAVSGPGRSEEHTSELQSRENLVCRLLLEKKKTRKTKKKLRA